MFDFLRKGATSIYAKIFLAVIVIVFVFWGIGSFTTSEKDVLAKVMGEKITLREFQEFYHYKLLQFRQTLGDLSEEELNRLNLKEQVLQELIKRKLLSQLAEDYGVKITQVELNMALKAIPFFQEKGQFDEQKYRAFLRELGLSQASFEKLLYTELLEEKIKTLITSPILVSKEEVQDFANFYFQKLEIEEYILPIEVCEREVKVNEVDLENYFHSHRNDYVEEEKVKLAILKLPFEGEVELTEEDLKNYYTQNLHRFREPFRVKIRKLFIPGVGEDALKRAQEERAKIKTLKDLEALGSKNGEWFEEGALPLEIKNFVRGAKPGDIIGPLRASQGYLILGIEEVQPERVLKFEEVKVKLVEELKKEKVREKVRAKANEIYAQIVRENGLQAWAQKRGIKLEYTSYLTLEEVSKYFSSREEAKKVFKAGKGDYFSPFESDKAIFLTEILEKKPKRNLNFEEAREAVKRDFLREKGKEVCETKIKNLVERSKSQKDISIIAQELAFRVNKKEIIRMDLPDELVDTLLKPGFSEKPLWSKGEIKLIHLTKITPQEKPLTSEEQALITQLLLKHKGEVLLKNLIESYQKKAKIKVYPLFKQL